MYDDYQKAARGIGMMGVDWEARIDYDRMRRERMQRAKDAVDKAEVDALFLFRLENVRYLSGLRTHMWPASSWMSASALLPRGYDAIIFSQDYSHATERMPWIRDRIINFPTGALEIVSGVRKWADVVKNQLAERGITPKRIGVDSWSPALFKALPEEFPGVEFVDGEAIMIEARKIKTRDEIACLKMAADITAAGMQAAREFIRPGVRECEVLAEAWRKMTALGSEWTQCSNIVCSGPYTYPYRRFTSDRIIQHGDFVIIDIGGMFNGYYGDFTRTWICGDHAKPTKEQIEIHMEAYIAIKNCAAAIKPGITTWEVARASGEHIVGRLGHGIGVAPSELPYLGVEALVPKEEAAVLEPGMVFSIEPYAGREGVGGVRLEHNILVTETGSEILDQFPFEPKLMA